jgi:hypothetical protein
VKAACTGGTWTSALRIMKCLYITGETIHESG